MKFLFSIHYLIWLALSGLLFAGGEFLSKKFALNPRLTLVVCILVIYSLGVLAWLPAILQKNQLSIVGAIWSVMSLLATVLIGFLLFGEKLSAVGVVGIITAFAAVALLSLN
jgi:multidrug transporter EmrE-like cation transporter